MRNLLLIIFIIFTLSSCDDALFNSGDTISMEYELDDFSEIYIEDIFDVFLIQDTICKIELIGGSNLLPDVEFNVSDSKLNISNNNGGNWSRNYERIKVYLSLKDITLLRLNESSNISCIDTLILPKLNVYSINDYSDISLTINCDNFYIVNSGTSGGYFTIKGKAINSKLWPRASCIIDARDLESIKSNIHNESIGNCYAGICQTLEVEILNSGNVYYKGNPETITYINEQAKEQLIKLD
ncbi:MAG: DUF2807 domain-containing protein [Bacteroidales bacterium]|nr:DUF2807 domain-containing protein [Bacteroidales bacterium]